MQNPIDARFENCVGHSSSDNDSVKCADIAREAWDGQLNTAYQNLQNKGTREQNGALKDAELKWITFRDKEFNSIDEIHKELGDGNASPTAAADKQAFVKDRTIVFQNRYGDYSNGDRTDKLNGVDDDQDDKDLNMYYQKLMKILDEPGKAALKASELAWIDFRDAEFKSLDKFYNTDSNGVRTQNIIEHSEVIQDRVRQLKGQFQILDGV